MQTGTVKRFNRIKGYGFIRPDQGEEEVFVHFSVIDVAGYKELKEGQRLCYTLAVGDKGYYAMNVTII